jgi:hypothetical protein
MAFSRLLMRIAPRSGGASDAKGAAKPRTEIAEGYGGMSRQANP